MIYVDYIQNGEKQTTPFTDVQQAIRFIRLGQSISTVLITGWRCDSPYDNEYINRRIEL